MSNSTDARIELDQKWDAVWQAMEETIVKLNELNDFCYDDAGEPLFRVPRVHAQVLESKAREIKQELNSFVDLKEPSRALPQLPLIAA